MQCNQSITFQSSFGGLCADVAVEAGQVQHRLDVLEERVRVDERTEPL